MFNFVWMILAFVLSYFIVAWIRKRSIQQNILDIPNERSSHTTPTPTGGGLGFVISFVLFLIILSISQQSDSKLVGALIGGGVLVAIIGYLDDRYELPAKQRLMGHFVAALWGVFLVGPIQNLNLGLLTLDLGIIGTFLSILGIVWLLNLFNFMDGIDGLAGLEAFFVSAGAGWLLLSSNNTSIAYPLFLLMASCFGFLVWNWPKAKIFMGDVGSGFLGYVFGILAIVSHQTSAVSIWVWLVLLNVFIVDTTVTVVRRMLRREKVLEAHRSHAYQHLTTRHSHVKVTILIFTMNMLVLLPIAILIWKTPELILPIMSVLVIVSIGVAIYFKAGKE